MRRATGLVFIAVLAVVLAGCGGGTKPTVTTATTPQAAKTTIRVYFLRAGKLQPVLRTVPKTQAVAAAALEALGEGPSEAEVRDLKLSSAVHGVLEGVAISAGVAQIPAGFDGSGRGQVVYTLTQFPTVKAVELEGKRYTRADFEDETPTILVESPLPFQKVTNPLRATGTANTFEATFEYELTDPDGKIIATHFVTATSGTGTRGTFDFSVPFTVDRAGLGELIVYERSAKDGSRIHLVEIPIRLPR
jgi:germination protein M